MNFTDKANRYFHTISNLKPKQVLYRLKYALSPVKKLQPKPFRGEIKQNIQLIPLPVSPDVLSVNNDIYTFKILNLDKAYQSDVNWSDEEYGRLWNYNLQYADFLNQEGLASEVREELILDLYEWLTAGRLKPEPYTASLRIMNIIRFISENSDSLNSSDRILNNLNAELQFLSGRAEYHISGNHLLENAFALLMGGFYLQNNKWETYAKEILQSELSEQILSDGAHFERSPMYHQIILFRVLEAISYLPDDSRLKIFLTSKAELMISWMRKMTFKSGHSAHFNDSVDGVAYSPESLIELAKNLGVKTETNISLSDSGYRRFNSDAIELIADVEGIKPDYQPGHAHADSLSFILNIHEKPFIVDPAVSTYEPGERRDWERSTRAHNTITVDDNNSADVWSAFRVGRRPKVKILSESADSTEAELRYTTQSDKKIVHTRRFNVSKNKTEITDIIRGSDLAKGRLYFAPEIQIDKISGNVIHFTNGVFIRIRGSIELNSFEYLFNEGFHKKTAATVLEYSFNHKSDIEINVE